MQDAADDNESLTPTELDASRLHDLQPDGRVEAENGTWIVCRYPPKPSRADWKPFVLMVNITGFSAHFECAGLSFVIVTLTRLEVQRRRARG